jgi:hypothetical protein
MKMQFRFVHQYYPMLDVKCKHGEEKVDDFPFAGTEFVSSQPGSILVLSQGEGIRDDVLVSKEVPFIP